MFKEHVDIFKHLKCFQVMCVCVFFLLFIFSEHISDPQHVYVAKWH